jgi:hypothetical protein
MKKKQLVPRQGMERLPQTIFDLEFGAYRSIFRIRLLLLSAMYKSPVLGWT